MKHGGSRLGSGRRKGTPNKFTSIAREAIETAAVKIGGADRLSKWAKESPENERAFWTQIYPKLMPLQVTGPDDEPLTHYVIFDRPPTEEEWERARAGEKG
jgi:hypothetical protein